MITAKSFDLNKEFVFTPASEEDEETPTMVRATPLSIAERNDLSRVMLVGGADSARTLKRILTKHIKELINIADQDGLVSNTTDPQVIWRALSDPINIAFYGDVLSGLMEASGLSDAEKKS